MVIAKAIGMTTRSFEHNTFEISENFTTGTVKTTCISAYQIWPETVFELTHIRMLVNYVCNTRQNLKQEEIVLFKLGIILKSPGSSIRF